jgi:purine-nucleoside phosphorylase
MGLLGAGIIILTNAAGGINKNFSAGDFMLIDDHILYNVPSPLIGKNYDMLGPRFPDMSCVYDVNLRRAVNHAANEIGINLRHGVYMQVSGPNYETPTEIKAYASMGADAVGMSTAIEAIAAVHMGIRVCGISCISNLASGISTMPLSHEEVQAASLRAAPEFKALLTKVISSL